MIPVAYLRVLKIIKNPDIVLRVQNEGSNPNPTSRVSHGIPFSIQGYPSACSLAEIRVTQLRSAVAVLASHKALPLPGVNRVNRSRRNRGSGGSASLRKQLLKNLPGSNHVTRKCEKNIEKHHWKNSDGKSRSGSRPIQNHPVTSVTVVSDVLTCSGTFWYRHVPSICLKSIDVFNMLIYFACPPREN